jgi:hypothetical protein
MGRFLTDFGYLLKHWWFIPCCLFIATESSGQQTYSNVSGACTVIVQGNYNSVSGNLHCVPSTITQDTSPPQGNDKGKDLNSISFSVKSFAFQENRRTASIDLVVENHSAAGRAIQFVMAPSSVQFSNPVGTAPAPRIFGLAVCRHLNLAATNLCLGQHDDFTFLPTQQPFGFRLEVLFNTLTAPTKGALNLMFIIKDDRGYHRVEISFMDIAVEKGN